MYESFFAVYMSQSNAESERKLSLNSCHCGLIISVCFTHISSVNHGKCGQRRAFIEVKSLFFSFCAVNENRSCAA